MDPQRQDAHLPFFTAECAVVVHSRPTLDGLAMTLPEQIDALQRQLNAAAIVDARWYRRNMTQYELLCYVNTLVALYVARNWEPVPLFIERATTYLDGAAAVHLSAAYVALVRHYLAALAEYVAVVGGPPNESSKPDA
jgi:hypothetical protein